MKEQEKNDSQVIDSREIFLQLGESSQLVLSDAQINQLIHSGALSITYDAAQNVSESEASGIMVELNADQLPPIRMVGKFLEGRTDAVSFEYEEPNQAEALGAWIHGGKPEPTTRISDELEYPVTPVTQKIARSLNEYVWRNRQDLIQAAVQQ
ncbi:hypothetical protein KA078_01850 [Candidatus Woesebacteria bacterium]|nr:hypothetical protein [Candidatus Woesebacteria bacterium]